MKYEKTMQGTYLYSVRINKILLISEHENRKTAFDGLIELIKYRIAKI